MQATPAAAVAAFARATAAGAFADGVLRAASAIAVAGAVALLVVRIAGGHLAPHPAWAAAAVPALVFGAWRARTAALPRAVAAQHLDRRLHLEGLLVCAHEGVALDAEWQGRVALALTRRRAVQPRIRWRRLLPWPLAAMAVATVVALLPPPAVPVTPARAAAAGEIERLTQTLRDLLARGAVPDEQAQELERALHELQQRLAAGEPPEWREIDQLEQRLEREQLLQAIAERPDAGGVPDPGRATAVSITPEQVAAAADALAALGLADALPEGLRAMLERAGAGGAVDPGALPQDAEALRRLAEAMARAAAAPEALAARASLSAGQLADLQAVVDAFAGDGSLGSAAGAAAGQLGGDEGEGIGGGGVSRGPGHAALAMTEDAQGGADAALALPPGVAAPTEWVPIGSRPSEPQVDPRGNTAAGGAGVAGTGGATWQLQLAPRHRAVVRRFFGDGGATDGRRR